MSQRALKKIEKFDDEEVKNLLEAVSHSNILE